MYEAPQVVDLGTLEELTEYKNKIGPTPDKQSAVIVGSVVTVP